MRTRDQLKSRLSELQAKSSYNKSEVMKNSHRMVKRYGGYNGEYLRECAKNENKRVKNVAEEIECLLYKIENYTNISVNQNNVTGMTQAGYNSTRTSGYMGSIRNS